MSMMKRYRLVIDYEVRVEDWSEEALKQRRADYEDADTPDFADWEGYQKRLFEALLKDPKRVEQYCRRAVLDSMELDIEYLLHHKEFDVPEEDDVIVEAFHDLSPQDAAYWKEKSQDEYFGEQSEFVRDQIDATLKRCTLQNLETGEEIEAQPHEPKDGESFIHSVEAFGTWAEDGDDSVPDEILDQISLSGIGLNEFMPPDIKEFLQGYALLRTVFTHVDPVTKVAEYTHKQLAQECNEWLKNNPVFTKDDLSCLKTYLRKQAYSKVHLHNLLQDMRGKTFFDLSKAFLSGAYSAPPPILTP